MAGVLGLLLPVLLKFIDWYFTKIGADKEMIESWQKFLVKAQENGFLKVSLWRKAQVARDQLINDIDKGSVDDSR